MRLSKNIKKKLRPILKEKALKYFYYDFKQQLLLETINIVRIQTTRHTLNVIENCITQNQRGVYMRFGDGDVFLLDNKNDSCQDANKFLAKEMMEAFKINGINVFKSLAIHSNRFGFEEGMFDGNHKNSDALSVNLLQATYMYFIGQKIYSPVALHFTATQNPVRASAFLKLLKFKTKLFIGNKETSISTIKMLFGGTKHIKTPSLNAYHEIDRIYSESINEIKKIDGFGVIVVAMGCSGRPLMKRLFNNTTQPIFLFDFGSLIDGFDGKKSRTWLNINTINYNKLTNSLI